MDVYYAISQLQGLVCHVTWNRNPRNDGKEEERTCKTDKYSLAFVQQARFLEEWVIKSFKRLRSVDNDRCCYSSVEANKPGRDACFPLISGTDQPCSLVCLV